nr:hypothetical protein Iba_scaffold2431CG0930 [Ipomoea batatas]
MTLNWKGMDLDLAKLAKRSPTSSVERLSNGATGGRHEGTDSRRAGGPSGLSAKASMRPLVGVAGGRGDVVEDPHHLLGQRDVIALQRAGAVEQEPLRARAVEAPEQAPSDRAGGGERGLRIIVQEGCEVLKSWVSSYHLPHTTLLLLFRSLR